MRKVVGPGPLSVQKSLYQARTKPTHLHHRLYCRHSSKYPSISTECRSDGAVTTTTCGHSAIPGPSQHHNIQQCRPGPQLYTRELNILWAVHQIHHSDEDFNFATAVRLSVLQRVAHFGFYHPLALIGFPLPTVSVHIAFNYLFQFWVHTKYIGSLGPIGWVFMTPSFHRVHHGANKWCLDKNYGSVFVIWDRIFGTFEPEKDNEEIVYGLTKQPQTHNALWHEVYYFVEVYRKARSMTTWGDSLKALFYGPGWAPGLPRLGDPSTFIDVKAPRIKYNPRISQGMLLYIASHMTLTFLAQQLMVAKYMGSLGIMLSMLIFIFVSVGVLTAMFDGWVWAPLAEAVRCAAFVACYFSITQITAIPVVDTGLLVYFTTSCLFWTTKGVNDMIFRLSTKKMK
nr:alkylglycerol monooxygenase-like isoform X2 [Cherax quadricarinatus]